MRPRRKDTNPKAGKDTPGPGAYIYAGQPNSVKSPSVKFGSQKRDKYANSETPGPGNYDISARPATAKSFGKAPRKTVSGQKDNPGPGAYMYEANKSGPQFSISSKNYKANPNDTPGPGTYGYAEPVQPGANIAIGTAKRGKVKREDMPGPGNYNSETSLRGPSYGFGTQTR